MSSNRPRRGQVQPLTRDAARCYPSKPMHACYGCARHRFGDPEPSEVRREPVIDASGFLIDGRCQMRVVVVRSARAALPSLSALDRAWRAAA